MSPIRTFRWLSMGLIAAALALAVTAGTAGAASSWGELGRFGGVDKKSKKGHKFLLEEAHAFGIDPTSNTVYVGDEKNEIEANQEFRLQQYNEAGTFEAEGIVNPGQKQGPTRVAGAPRSIPKSRWPGPSTRSRRPRSAGNSCPQQAPNRGASSPNRKT
jgi:hypothetical protein